MPGAVAKNMIRRQSNEWKEKNLKVGIYHGKDADIIEVGALEALIKERAESPLVDDT